MVINTVPVRLVLQRGESVLVQNIDQAMHELEIPGIGFHEGEELGDKPADEEVELVESQRIDAGPLAAHGEEEGGEVL